MQKEKIIMQEVAIVFPHQLFKDNLFFQLDIPIYLVEEYLFFNQYNFHKQKLLFHRASMKYYEIFLQLKEKKTVYVNAQEKENDVRFLIEKLHIQGITTIHIYEVVDNWLQKRIVETCKKFCIKVSIYPTPLFINSTPENESYYQQKQKLFQTDFYVYQRKKLGILIDDKQKPIAGKWSFDAENRLKYPANKIPPTIQFPTLNKFVEEAIEYVYEKYDSNIGVINKNFVYPTTHKEAAIWLQQFVTQRLQEFGAYEDAMVQTQTILHHSVLTPMLNVGLLTPMQIVNEVVQAYTKQNFAIASVEGFIRQVIGWREFIRAVYELKGTQERTTNYWKFTRKIPANFYNGTTGIEPVDVVIKRVLQTGYCHHIERLMVLGNFMLLCEFHPNQVYTWFMELFIDAYDWVMVPNVYGMSQFADGGIMATKPYISGSNYILKMSDYKKGKWCDIWDGLFWRFMHVHRDFFLQNPRLGMLVRTFDKMPEEKRNKHLKTAEDYLKSL